MGKIVKCRECGKSYRDPEELEDLRDNDSTCLVCNGTIEVADWDRVLASYEEEDGDTTDDDDDWDTDEDDDDDDDDDIHDIDDLDDMDDDDDDDDISEDDFDDDQ